MANKTSKGPWYPVEYSGFYRIQRTPYYSRSNVMDLDITKKATENALLAASAPALLNELKRLYNKYGEEKTLDAIKQHL